MPAPPSAQARPFCRKPETGGPAPSGPAPPIRVEATPSGPAHGPLAQSPAASRRGPASCAGLAPKGTADAASEPRGAGRGDSSHGPAQLPRRPRALVLPAPSPSFAWRGALGVPGAPGPTCRPTACQRRTSSAAGGCWQGPLPDSARGPRRPPCSCRCARCAGSQRCSTRCGPAAWPGGTRATSGTRPGAPRSTERRPPSPGDRRDLSEALRLSESGFPPLWNGSGESRAPSPAPWVPARTPRRTPRSASRTSSGPGHFSELCPCF